MSARLRHPRSFIVLIALLGALLLTGGVVLGATVTKSGRGITALRAVTRDTSVNTTALGYVDVPDMSLSVNVPSNTTALFMIQFSANAACVASGAVSEHVCPVRALVDGVNVGPGISFFRTALSKSYETGSTHWVAGPFGAGSHVVKI